MREILTHQQNNLTIWLRTGDEPVRYDPEWDEHYYRVEGIRWVSTIPEGTEAWSLIVYNRAGNAAHTFTIDGPQEVTFTIPPGQRFDTDADHGMSISRIN